MWYRVSRLFVQVYFKFDEIRGASAGSEILIPKEHRRNSIITNMGDKAPLIYRIPTDPVVEEVQQRCLNLTAAVWS